MRQSPLLSGLMYSMSFMLVGSLLASLLLVFSNIQENEWSSLTLGIHGFAMLVGGFIAGKRSGSKGWYHGAVLGLLYAAIVWMIGFLAYDTGFSEQTLYVTLLSIASGAVGGMIGVNTKR